MQFEDEIIVEKSVGIRRVKRTFNFCLSHNRSFNTINIRRLGPIFVYIEFAINLNFLQWWYNGQDVHCRLRCADYVISSARRNQGHIQKCLSFRIVLAMWQNKLNSEGGHFTWTNFLRQFWFRFDWFELTMLTVRSETKFHFPYNSLIMWHMSSYVILSFSVIMEDIDNQFAQSTSSTWG